MRQGSTAYNLVVCSVTGDRIICAMKPALECIAGQGRTNCRAVRKLTSSAGDPAGRFQEHATGSPVFMAAGRGAMVSPLTACVTQNRTYNAYPGAEQGFYSCRSCCRRRCLQLAAAGPATEILLDHDEIAGLQSEGGGCGEPPGGGGG